MIVRPTTLGWVILALAVGCCAACCRAGSPAPTPTPTPEPLVPTPIRGTAAAKGAPTPTPTLAEPLPSPAATGNRERFGLCVPIAAGSIADYAVDGLGLAWYLDWQVKADPPRPGGIDYWQMVRLSEEGYHPAADRVRAAALANPGATWLIGNEPDVIWQDNVTPERYAELYHELYELLKAADPTCRVAIAGVSQATPLRLAYLDRILEGYQRQYGAPMPVDVWNVHAFVLREERDSWGVSIPPGLDAQTGKLYEIEDHDDMDLFRAQILDFRRWMAERGQRDRPLVVSEYGLLMPEDYGFDRERVRAFMYATFDYFLTAADERVGYPQDGNRLVQWWAWYSLADTRYATSSLFDPQSKALLPLGADFAQYAGPP